MLSKDLIRILNKYNKKHPEANVYFLTDSTEIDFINVEKTGVVFAPEDQMKQNKIDPDDCIKDHRDGYVPVIILG